MGPEHGVQPPEHCSLQEKVAPKPDSDLAKLPSLTYYHNWLGCEPDHVHVPRVTHEETLGPSRAHLLSDGEGRFVVEVRKKRTFCGVTQFCG